MSEHNWRRLPPELLDKYSKKPIFIIGSPRSGTTVMRHIIDGHHNIFCPYVETFLFNSLQPMLNGHIWNYQLSNSPFSRADYLQWIRDFVLQFFANYGSACGKQRFAEKTPSHAEVMDLIKETFPDALFIHMIRNGIDVVRSLLRMKWAPNDVFANTKTWVKSINTARKFSTCFPKEDYLEVRLENLRIDYENQVKRICTFIGEDFTSTMLNYHLPENNSWQMSLAPFTPGEDTRTNIPKLSRQETKVFMDIAGPLMQDLGYT